MVNVIHVDGHGADVFQVNTDSNGGLGKKLSLDFWCWLGLGIS